MTAGSRVAGMLNLQRRWEVLRSTPHRDCPRCGCLSHKEGLTRAGVQLFRCHAGHSWRETYVEKRDIDRGGRTTGRLISIESFGRCLRCGAGPNDRANGLCDSCHEDSSSYQRFYYRKRLKGLCIQCQALTEPGYTLCLFHRNKRYGDGAYRGTHIGVKAANSL